MAAAAAAADLNPAEQTRSDSPTASIGGRVGSKARGAFLFRRV